MTELDSGPKWVYGPPNRAGPPNCAYLLRFRGYYTDTASLTFGVLEEAQALGDRQALLDAGRRVMRLHLGEDVVGGIERLLEGSS